MKGQELLSYKEFQVCKFRRFCMTAIADMRKYYILPFLELISNKTYGTYRPGIFCSWTTLALPSMILVRLSNINCDTWSIEKQSFALIYPMLFLPNCFDKLSGRLQSKCNFLIILMLYVALNWQLLRPQVKHFLRFCFFHSTIMSIILIWLIVTLVTCNNCFCCCCSMTTKKKPGKMRRYIKISERTHWGMENMKKIYKRMVQQINTLNSDMIVLTSYHNGVMGIMQQRVSF